MTKAEVAALAAELAEDPEVTTLSLCALKTDGGTRHAASAWPTALDAQQLIWGLMHLVRDLLGPAPEKIPESQSIQ